MAKQNEQKLVSTKPLSVLITIMNREKVNYYVDLIGEHNVNMQMIANGNGTTKSSVFLNEVGNKAVIFSIINEDDIKPTLAMLQQKFNTVKDGKGVAFTVPLTSVMGVRFYNFLSNNKLSMM